MKKLTNSSFGRSDMAAWLGAVSVLAISVPSVAWAQDADGADVAAADDASAAVDDATSEDGGAIVVTGSRVARSGFVAPTPVTALTSAEMNVRAPATIADTLATIPSFRATNTPTTSGVTTRGGGIITADLRALGATRSLVLLDGHRFVPSGSDGVVDLKLIPQLLIKQVDVVTGGASAAYGSDAVAGVVNFKLDTGLRGLAASLQGGISGHGDGESIRASIAAGGSFGDDAVTFVVGGDYAKLYGIGNQYSRDWGRDEVGLIVNPLYATNGEPNYIISPNVHPSALYPGGLVFSGPLRGLTFLPNGQTGTFTFGQLYGATASSMIGGDNEGNNLSNATLLSSPVESYTGLGHIEFHAAPAVTPYLELSYGRTETNTQSQQPRMTGPLAIPVSINNAFLPDSVKALMVQNGLTSISVGRLFNDTGPVRVNILNETTRVLAGVKGDLGGSWSYDAYYQWGRNDSNVEAGPNNLTVGRFFAAVAGCPGPLAAQGCIPQNIFGDGSVKVDDWSFGTAWFRVKTQQHVASLNLNGEPLNTWAGPVSFATGVEYRKEKAAGTSDAISQLLVPQGTSGKSIAGGHLIGNQLPINGSYDLWEVYGETVVPLLRDAAFARSLDLNAAIRRTDYSTSGAVTTWKLGLTWQVDDALRLRATRSRDIRAPNINDLFQFGGSQFAVVFDPVVGSTVQTRYVTLGNPGLKPEKANTWTAGLVYEPSWLPGAGFSIDYYDIAVNGVIGVLPPSVVVANCQAGDTASCGSIVKNADGSIAFFNLQTANLSSLKTAGIDFEARYQTALPLFGDESGKLSLRALATYVDKLDTITPAGILHRVSTLSTFNGPGDTSSGVPHLTGVFDLTYSTDRWLLNLNTRLVGAGKFNRDFTEGAGAARTINDNHVPAYAYLGLAGQYELPVGNAEVQVFGAINNLLDTDPPMIPSGTVGFANETSTNPAFYDVVGRSFTLGVRMKI